MDTEAISSLPSRGEMGLSRGCTDKIPRSPIPGAKLSWSEEGQCSL